MIHKLKKKFTLLATASMLLLMSLLILIMNGINYTSVIRESDQTLDVLSFPGAPFLKENGLPKDDPDFRDFIPRGMSPEVPFEARFFSVVADENGKILSTDASRMVSVDDERMISFAETALQRRADRGFLSQFRYVKVAVPEGTRVIFLDCGRKLAAFRVFLWISMSVGLLGCLLVFLIFLFASGRIVRPIVESNEKQKRFITDAGHEIRTPLTVINANLDLLEMEDPDNPELNRIRVQTKRLTDLTGALVQLSKMEEGTKQTARVDFPFSDLVAEIAASFEAIAQTHRIEYVRKISPALTLYGSPDSLGRLVSILLDNALKYTPEGGIVTVELNDRKKALQLLVRNTTKETLSEKDLSHLFDRFYRTDASRNSETGGHGIGLSIANAIVRSHGGSIRADAQGERDLTITADFPKNKEK